MTKAIYRWTITRDRICDGEAKGTTGPRNADESVIDNPTRFTMYDDDGECYYDGMLYGDFSGFEPLDDFGMSNAGCTAIKINGEWV